MAQKQQNEPTRMDVDDSDMSEDEEGMSIKKNISSRVRFELNPKLFQEDAELLEFTSHPRSNRTAARKALVLV